MCIYIYIYIYVCIYIYIYMDKGSEYGVYGLGICVQRFRVLELSSANRSNLNTAV